jgi:hypothetical protein
LNFISVFRATAKKYLALTTVHGLAHATNKESFLTTRMIWAGLVAASLSAFTYYSLSAYTRWHEEPIVINLDDKLAEIHEIPFPAVTLKTYLH